MKIITANDHGAIELKKSVVQFLEAQGHQITNLGVDTSTSVDYPDIAKNATEEYLKGGYDFGILFCGTGIGISIAANKINGIRAALVHNKFTAKMAKAHNNANFIVLGGRIEYQDSVEEIISSFMETDFEGDRHQKRLDKISALEK